MPVKRADRRDWPDFTETAWRQFLALPRETQNLLVGCFPEFARAPTRPSPTLDVVPIRDDPRHWRLKVQGYRVLFQVRQGRALVEEIEPRTGETYVRFGRYTSSRQSP